MFARLVAELWSKFPVIMADPPGIAPWLIAGAEITLPSSTTARSSRGERLLPYWLYILPVRVPNALAPAGLKLRFTCQKLVPCWIEALALWISLPSTRDLSSAYLYRTPLIVPQDTICRWGSFQSCGLYPISFCQFGLAQLSLLNSAFTCGLTSAWFPLAVCQVEVAPGGGEAAALAVADGLGLGALADGEGLGVASTARVAVLPRRLCALRVSSTAPPAAPRTKALV